MTAHRDKIGVAVLFLALTLSLPLSKQAAHSATTALAEPAPHELVTTVTPTASIYHMYTIRYPNYRRRMLANMVDGVIAVGGAAGLLCGVQLAAGVTFAA